MESKITVLKFGSSVLQSEADLPRIVHEIYRHYRTGSQVLVVVSALGATTDELLRRAENLCDEPHHASLATLLATGEATSAALLGLAVHRAGIPVRVLSPEQIGLKTTGATLDAELVAANTKRLQRELPDAVVIASGFVGVNESGDLTTLGRGGSDYVALFLAEKLGARCILIKDVAGLYQSNPKQSGVLLQSRPRRFECADWKTARAVGGGVVQPKALRFAEKRRLSFSIAALGANGGTEICGDENELAEDTETAAPLRVALLGCGIVGGGVYQRLSELPEFFTVTGIAVSNKEKKRRPEIPAHFLTTDAAALVEKPCDVVVELIGGTGTTGELITRALNSGRHVVTANKALLAGEIDRLENLAQKRGATIRYSAAVGGAMPALEIVSSEIYSGDLRSFSGIVNGTCNFVCDELAKGKSFGTAVRAAQEAGFAEADPTLDLSGADAAQKTLLLARAAFGSNLPFKLIKLEGIENLTSETVQRAAKTGLVVRLVAGCYKIDDDIKAVIRPLELPAAHPFARTRGAENCLQIETLEGKTKYIRGAGAGRWATTEAVIADLLELHREFAGAPVVKRLTAIACTQPAFSEFQL